MQGYDNAGGSQINLTLPWSPVTANFLQNIGSGTSSVHGAEDMNGLSDGTAIPSDMTNDWLLNLLFVMDKGGVVPEAGDHTDLWTAIDTLIATQVAAALATLGTTDNTSTTDTGGTSTGNVVFTTAGGTYNNAENLTGTGYTAAATPGTGGAAVTYSLTGPDAALFDLDATTGVLTWIDAPDYETKIDADGDGSYVLTVTASETGGGSASQTVIVQPTDVYEVNLILI